MEEEKKKAYSEVVEILKLIEDEDKIGKIPFEVVELIKNNSDKNYKPTIDKEKPLEEQELKDETYSILAWIASKYWNEDINIESIEKARKTDLTSTNNIEITEQIKKHNTTKDLLPKASVYNDMEPELLAQCDELGIVPIYETENTWFTAIKEKVIKLLKILFRVKKAENDIKSSGLIKSK